jgi:hypothetical protein
MAHNVPRKKVRVAVGTMSFIPLIIEILICGMPLRGISFLTAKHS